MRKNSRFILKVALPLMTLGVISQTFAADCALKNGPSPDISAYIVRLNSDLSRLKSEAQKTWCGNSKPNLSRLSSDAVRIYNETSNFTNFTASTDFWIRSAINADFPTEFTRDFILLKKQTDKINSAMDSIARNCGNTNGIGNILSDHINIMQAYMQVTTGKWNDLAKIQGSFKTNKEKNASLVGNLFNYYVGSVKDECKSTSGTSMIISEISYRMGQLSDGFQSSFKNWTYAWKLITGDKPDKNSTYEQVERNLLKKELSKQWISTERSSAMLTCLSSSGCKNDAGSANVGYTGMAGFLENIRKRAETTGLAFVSMYEKVRDNLKDAYSTPNVHVYLSRLKSFGITQEIIWGNTSDTTKTLTNSTYASQLGIDKSTNGISDDYEVAKQLIYADNIELADGVGNAKMIHELLNATIKAVKDATPLAEKACEGQARWLWRCRY